HLRRVHRKPVGQGAPLRDAQWHPSRPGRESRARSSTRLKLDSYLTGRMDEANLFIAAITMIFAACQPAAVRETPPGPATGGASVEWPYYGSDAGGQRFSPLVQINRDNVSQLKVAWVYHTGDISDGGKDRSKSGFENTPIV